MSRKKFLVSGYWSLVAGYWLLAAGSKVSAAKI
jgi:hypothetical protein